MLPNSFHPVWHFRKIYSLRSVEQSYIFVYNKCDNTRHKNNNNNKTVTYSCFLSVWKHIIFNTVGGNTFRDGGIEENEVEDRGFFLNLTNN